MSAKETHAKVVEVRSLAVELAERCGFDTANAIKKASAICGKYSANIYVEFHSTAERAEILTCFTYGVAMIGWSFSCSSREYLSIIKKRRTFLKIRIASDND